MFKYINIILSAILLLSACTKSEVQHEDPAEIGFAPAARNVTKAVMEGPLNGDVRLGVWAYWNGTDGNIETGVADYSIYNTPFLADSEFGKKDVNWGGIPAYYWPNSGALVFAGYTKNRVVEQEGGGSWLHSVIDGNVKYDLSSDTMTIPVSIYPQLNNSFDLCWFGRTSASYNNRTNGDPVPVTLHHAMSWITIKVKGDATTGPEEENKRWRIKGIVMKDAFKEATGSCSISEGGVATTSWTLSEGQTTDVDLGRADGDTQNSNSKIQSLTQEAVPYEAVANALIVIPQPPLKLAVTYECPTAGGSYTEKTVEVDLTLTGHKDEDGNDIAENERIDMWKSGIHYTYTLVFKANEILVAPSFGKWETSDQTITVE